MHIDVGVDRDRLLIARIDPRAAGYATAELPELYRRVADRVAAVPGVQAASLSMNGLFANSNRVSGMSVEGFTAPSPDQSPRTNEELVTPDYFRTVGLRILYGRAFTPQDTDAARNVSVINETMARRFFGDGSRALGKRWTYGSTFDNDAFEIVGVVEDARYNDLKIESMNMAYRPAVQEINEYLTSVEIRTTGPPAALATDVRNALRQLEPRLPVTSIETLDERVVRSMGQVRLMTWLTTAFGAVALFLACLGLYGTISYAVTRRTAELGVRMALGASRGAVQWLIMREALTLVAFGLVVGIPLAFFAADAMQKLLYDVTPADPMANAGAIGMLVLIAALAAYLPARRASRVDPMHALRAD
jgi:predicted permease